MGEKFIITKELSVVLQAVGTHQNYRGKWSVRSLLQWLWCRCLPHPFPPLSPSPHWKPQLWLQFQLSCQSSIPMAFHRVMPQINKIISRKNTEVKKKTHLHFPLFKIIISHTMSTERVFPFRGVTCSAFIFLESWKKSHFFLGVFLIIGP